LLTLKLISFLSETVNFLLNLKKKFNTELFKYDAVIQLFKTIGSEITLCTTYFWIIIYFY